MTRHYKSPPTPPLHLTNDLIDLLAEILVQDYQHHRRNTVDSPPLTNRKFPLTKAAEAEYFKQARVINLPNLSGGQ